MLKQTSFVFLVAMILTLSPAKVEEEYEDRPIRKHTIRNDKAFKDSVTSKKLVSRPVPKPKTYTGLASWYGFESCVNPTDCRIADGSRFTENDFTLACVYRFPLGTRFRLSYKGKTVEARCTDRGNFDRLGRTFDLSKGTFRALAPLSVGQILVTYNILD